MKFFKKIFKKQEPEPLIRLLPPSVIYALGNEKGMLKKEHLVPLLDYRFYNEVSYLYLRLQSQYLNPQEMAEEIKHLSNAILSKDNDYFKKVMYSKLEMLGSKATIGVKLAQLSRQGFEFWYELYEKKTQEYLNNKTVPTILAYAPLIGIRSFVKLNRFNIIDLKLIASGSEIIGYKVFILESKTRVDFMYRHEKHYGVFLDDTKKTGAKHQILEEFAKANNWEFRFDCLCTHLQQGK